MPISQQTIDRAIAYLRQGHSRRHIRLHLMPGEISDPTLKKYCGHIQEDETKKRHAEFCQQVEAAYVTEKRISHLARQLGTYPDAVTNALRERGIPIVDVLKSNQHARGAAVNEDYFESIDSSEKAYYLGLMYADGAVHMRDKPCKNIVKISLKEEDAYILDTLNERTNAGRAMYRYVYPDGRGKPSITWNVNSKKMCLDLISHGCFMRKSAILEWPHIEDRFLSAFMRGMFDGDGSMHFSKQGSLCISLTTSHSFGAAFKLFYAERFGGACYVRTHINYCEVHLNVPSAKIAFYHYLYGDKECSIYLKRKKAVVERYIDHCAERGTIYDKVAV